MRKKVFSDYIQIITVYVKDFFHTFHWICRDQRVCFNFSDIRAAYQSRENVITDEKLSKIKEPIQLLDEWFELAKNHPNILEPHAVCLATATK